MTISNSIYSHSERDFVTTTATAGITITSEISNTDNTNAASNARVHIISGGAASGDPFVKFEVTGAQIFANGIDNSDSDILKWTDGATPSAGNERLALTTAGNLRINNAFTLPNADGAAGFVLATDGAGTVGWATNGAISVVRQVITASGNYVPTAGMIYCDIEILGGGGAGGGSRATGAGQVSVGAGGGGGEYARGVFDAATIGALQVVTIGAAGAANVGAAGGNGGNSSVGALISANGGTGGSSSVAASGASAGGVLGGTGGAGGDVRTPGQCGVGSSASHAIFYLPGQGGNSQYGSGGRVTTGGAGTGIAGLGYGSGGGGSCLAASTPAVAGGAGTPGIVIITEYCA